MSAPSPSIVSPFAEIIPLLAHLPSVPPVPDGATLAQAFAAQHVQPGPLLPLLEHLQHVQQKIPTLAHPRLCVFASHYAGGAAATAQTIEALQSDTHPLKQLAAQLNADLRVYELDLAQTTRSHTQAAQAMMYGMLAVEEKGDVLVIASVSDGAEIAAKIFDLPATDDADTLLHAVADQMGLDFCAALGACLAARLAGQPVLVSGAFGAALIAVLQALQPDAAAHVYACAPNEMTAALPPVFTPVSALQQTRFLLSFLPAAATRQTVHLSARVSATAH